MSLIVDFTLGAIKEMAPPELKEWLDNAPEKAGGATVRFIKGMLDAGTLKTPEGEKKLREKLEENPDAGEKIMSSILEAQASESDSLLPRYLQILNIVIDRIKTNKRPIVTKGFLHSKTAVTYWHFPEEKLDRVEKFAIKEGENSIGRKYPSELSIYFLEDQLTQEGIDELNLSIRTAQGHQLAQERYRGSFRIRSIEEFQIIGEWPQDMFKPPPPAIPIPFGVPGVATMLLSVDRALEKQRYPFRVTQEATDPFIHKPD